MALPGRVSPAERERRSQQVEGLALELESLRVRVAGEALDGALAALESEREAIDYGLTAAAYELAVAASSEAVEDETTSSEPNAMRTVAIERFESFVAHYEREVGRVGAASETQASQPVANLAPPETAVESNPSADSGSAITSCHLNGRVVFMRKAQCAQAGGR